MIDRRHLILGASFFAIAGQAFAADSSARAFVTQIYDTYKGKDSKGYPLDDERAIRRTFEPTLAALMIKDMKEAARRREVGALDGDPFIDAQDWEITAFEVAVGDEAGGRTKATVKFTNLGDAKTIVLDLVKIKGDWRVSDITWMRDGKANTLRGLFVRK